MTDWRTVCSVLLWSVPVVDGRHCLVMHQQNQAVTIVTQTITGFCCPRLAAENSVVKGIGYFTLQLAIVVVERGRLNPFGLSRFQR